jgi:hypothetical protein
MSVTVTDASTLQEAITVANNGACVDATVTNNITLTGASSAQQLTGTLTLAGTSGVEIGGNGGAGFVIGSGGSLISSNLTFTGFVTSGDGGVFNIQSGGSLSLNDNVITMNTAMGSNTVSAEGGAVFVAPGGSATLTNSNLSNNQATGGAIDEGGGIWASGIVTLTDSTVGNNSATGGTGGNGEGGGIWVGPSGKVHVTGSTVGNNSVTGGDGGGIDVNGANGSGGGIFNTGTVTLTNSTLQGNTATGGAGEAGGSGGTGDGGGIFQSGTLILQGLPTTLTSNQALGGSGGAGGAGGIGQGGGIDSDNGLFQLDLGATNPELLVDNDAIVGGTLNLTFTSEEILQNLINQPIKFFTAGGNVTGDFDALEIDGMSCQWTPSSAGGGMADCADPFSSSGVLAYQVAVDELPGAPPDAYYQLEITNLAAVPEPGTLSLLGPSIGVLFLLRRGGRRRHCRIARLL